MRSRHELLVVAIAVGGVLGGTRLLSAQEAPPAPAETAPPAVESAQAPPPAAAPAKATESASANATSTEAAEVEAATGTSEEKRATTPPKAVGATPGRFEPSEKVRADFDVSFPIDI